MLVCMKCGGEILLPDREKFCSNVCARRYHALKQAAEFRKLRDEARKKTNGKS